MSPWPGDEASTQLPLDFITNWTGGCGGGGRGAGSIGGEGGSGGSGGGGVHELSVHTMLESYEQPVPQQTATSLASQSRIPCAAHSAFACAYVAMPPLMPVRDGMPGLLAQIDPPHVALLPPMLQHRTTAL